MTPEETALRNAVIADPDNDLPRLVLADYLEEEGHPEYAEFVRVSCELERTDPEDDLPDEWGEPMPNPAYQQLADRQRVLFFRGVVPKDGIVFKNLFSWVQPPDQIGGLMKRGFVETIRCRPSDLVAGKLDEAFLRNPIRHVSAAGVTPAFVGHARLVSRIGEEDTSHNTALHWVPYPVAMMVAEDPACVARVEADAVQEGQILSMTFRDRAVAMAALEDACLKYGRRLVSGGRS